MRRPALSVTGLVLAARPRAPRVRCAAADGDTTSRADGGRRARLPADRRARLGRARDRRAARAGRRPRHRRAGHRLALGVDPVGCRPPPAVSDGFLSYLAEDAPRGVEPSARSPSPTSRRSPRCEPDLILSNRTRHEAIYEQLTRSRRRSSPERVDDAVEGATSASTPRRSAWRSEAEELARRVRQVAATALGAASSASPPARRVSALAVRRAVTVRVYTRESFIGTGPRRHRAGPAGAADRPRSRPSRELAPRSSPAPTPTSSCTRPIGPADGVG